MKKLGITAVLLSLIILSGALVPSTLQHDCTAPGSKILKSAGTPPYYAGEPPDNQTCAFAGCHDGITGVPNTGSAILNLNLGGAQDGYQLSRTYIFTVGISKAGGQRFGFQLVPVLGSDYAVSPGTITLIDTLRTQKRDKDNVTWGCCWQNRVWVTHTYEGITPVSPGYNEWSFQWQAPDTDIGDITFYLAVLEADNTLTDTLDYTYTRQVTITMDTSTAILNHRIPPPSVIFFPNPFSEQCKVIVKGRTSELHEPVIHIYDCQGRLVKTQILRGQESLLNRGKLASGVYFYQITNHHEITDRGKLVIL